MIQPHSHKDFDRNNDRAEAKTRTMTPRRKQLLEDARRAGYQVQVAEEGHIEIVRRHARTGAILHGLVIYPNGTGFDAAVPLSVARGMRSYRDFRSTLKLQPE
ncbi:MAG: hypothetical protein ACYTFG_00065 [Planctomycetota bacterium]|jgi:hypothetical protein